MNPATLLGIFNQLTTLLELVINSLHTHKKVPQSLVIL